MYWPEVGWVENDSPFIGKCVIRPGIVDRQLDRFGREAAERDVVEPGERTGVDGERRGVQHQAVDVDAGHDEQVLRGADDDRQRALRDVGDQLSADDQRLAVQLEPRAGGRASASRWWSAARTA